jgi:hypothetical protein
MKKIIVALLMGSGIICSIPNANGREHKEHLSREFTLTGDASNATLYIYNISGFIKVEGYAGNKVILEMDKTITADNEKDLEAGKNEFMLAFGQQSDSIIAYISSPFDSRPRRKWNHNYDRDDIEYEFNVEFTVKVPFNMNLHIATVNEGAVVVSNVGGILNVNNVNDEIRIDNAKGKTRAHTVNGDVTVSYVKNPPEESSYYTINGDITVKYQPDLSADMQFKSMNGEFFTDFPSAQLLPATVKKVQEKKGDGLVYKLNSSTAVRFGNGGRTFKFETLNGNVYIKKQS